jgi:protein-S-isoprenylcysteine O-methyltransferase Ste14
MVLASIAFAATVLLPAIDHRYGWSNVPTPIALLGNAIVALGFLAVLLVFRENTYGASTIQVAEGQKVISTGPYALVRHPMYAASLVLMAGIPLALGSWWGLLMLLPGSAILVWRLLDEESFLTRNLPGYAQYTDKVRHRLVPFVW